MAGHTSTCYRPDLHDSSEGMHVEEQGKLMQKETGCTNINVCMRRVYSKILLTCHNKVLLSAVLLKWVQVLSDYILFFVHKNYGMCACILWFRISRLVTILKCLICHF
jgi:hypothetical protein